MSISVSDTGGPNWIRLPFDPLLKALRLYARHWAALILIAAIGSIATDLLMYAAIDLGLRNALLGMITLSLVVLAKLVVIVLTLQAIKPDLPNISRLSGCWDNEATAQSKPASSFSLVAITLLPFFAYYAAWGFLSDTVREYSRGALDKVPFGEKANFLELMQTKWLIGSIVLCWLLRLGVKRINAARPAPIWPYVIVACDATWIFIGLYGISVWQGEFMRWLTSGAAFQSSNDAAPNLFAIGPAHAAEGFVPKEMQPPGLFAILQSLFFYALLPLVWFVMVAIIFGYDMTRTPPKAKGGGHPQWRNWLGDFVKHFIGGLINRYRPVLRSISLALGAGIPALCALVVGYRLIDYAGAWVWMGFVALAGERPLLEWEFLAVPVNLLFGSLSDQNGGILLNPLRLCLLAAAFDQTVGAADRGGQL